MLELFQSGQKNEGAVTYHFYPQRIFLNSLDLSLVVQTTTKGEPLTLKLKFHVKHSWQGSLDFLRDVMMLQRSILESLGFCFQQIFSICLGMT